MLSKDDNISRIESTTYDLCAFLDRKDIDTLQKILFKLGDGKSENLQAMLEAIEMVQIHYEQEDE